jgi:hypothetical protein
MKAIGKNRSIVVILYPTMTTIAPPRPMAQSLTAAEVLQQTTSRP